MHQQLSQQLDRLVQPVIGGRRDYTEAITANIGEFEKKVDFASQLIHLRFNDKRSHQHAKIRNKMNQLHNRLDRVNGVRNDLIHGLWRGWNEVGIGLVRVLPKTSTYTWKIKTYTPDQLEKTGKEMFDIHRDLFELEALIYKTNQEEASAGRIAE